MSSVERYNPMSLNILQLSHRDYANYLSEVVWICDVPWKKNHGVLFPVTSPHIPLEIDRNELRRALLKHKALMAMWTSHWDIENPTEWWWIACDIKNYDITKVTKDKMRQKIRKGLKSCDVRPIHVDEFCRLSYPIYHAALISYGIKPMNEKNYCKHYMGLAAYPGEQFWGSFYHDQMASYTHATIVDGAVILVDGKHDPKLGKFKATTAMEYTMLNHYLNHGFRYVTNGWRPMLHDTNISDFLEDFEFRKVFCRLEIELSPLAKIVDRFHILNLLSYSRLNKILGYNWKKLESFNKLLRIAESFS